ncbi:MAG TPA: hypothetical protein PLW54_03365, partial [Bacteroidia bacterium]|nr:hypothetical protein [Bacteroidia bacterium]
TLGDFILGVDSGYYDVSLVALPSQYYYKESMPDTSQIFARDSVSNIIIGARSPIRSISPSKGFPGQSCITATIVAEGIFAPTQFPSGNVTWGRVSYGNFYGQSNGNSVEYVSQDTIRVTFDLPDFTPLGLTPVQVCCSGSAWFCCISAPLFEVEPAPSRISGKVYYDANSNGQFDVGELPIGFQKILVDPGPSLTYSSTIGDYSCPASVGQHNVRFQSSGPISYLTSNPSSYSFTNTGDTAGVNFGLHSNAADYTTTISLSPGWPRCGNPETYVITIMNISNVASQGTVQAYKSQQQLYISMNPNTGVIHNDTLTWSFSNLQPMQTMTFTYTVQNPISGILRNSVRVNVMDPAGNVLFSDGTTTIEQIVCSFDPNDKHVSPEGYDPLEHYTNSSDSLVYTIRFQNTGTDSAIRIVVLDTISPWLDLSTFELLHSSHPMNITLDRGRVVRFLFDNIRLPDSTVDEPGSHGLIRYRIWPYPGLPEKTRVENTAYIFFDFNLPVQTNTVWNSMVSVIPLGFGESEGLPEQLAFFPNPVQDRAQLLFRNDAAEEAVLSVFNLNGRLLEKIRTNSDRFEIKREGKSPGLYQYFIDCQTSGKRLHGRFIVE